jgi:hypothetical protein
MGWVDCQLGGREPEDQPAVADIDVRELEHITKENPVRLGVLAVDNRVRPHYHDGI